MRRNSYQDKTLGAYKRRLFFTLYCLSILINIALTLFLLFYVAQRHLSHGICELFFKNSVTLSGYNMVNYI